MDYKEINSSFFKYFKNNCSELELNIEKIIELQKTNLSRFLSPIDNSSNFKFNKFLEKLQRIKNKPLSH